MIVRRTASCVLTLVLAAGTLAGVTAGPSAAANSTYAIGDSVMLGAKPQLKARGITVNANVSRHFHEVAPLVRKLKKRGKLPRTVVVAVGLNTSGIRLSQCTAIVSAAGPSRNVWLVTIKGKRSWVPANNRVLKKCAARTRANLIPWHSYARGHKSWFYADGLHLTRKGAKAYAKFVDWYV